MACSEGYYEADVESATSSTAATVASSASHLASGTAGRDSPSPHEPPPPPNPASDPQFNLVQLIPPQSPAWGQSLDELSGDIYQVDPRAIITLLAQRVECLVRQTGDVPSSPAPISPETPRMRAMEVEKQEIKGAATAVASARVGSSAPCTPVVSPASSPTIMTPTPSVTSPSLATAIDGVRLRATPVLRGAIPPPPTPQLYVVVGANSQPLNSQHSVITRKFYSKAPPPIEVTKYLSRLYRFCPASAGVYLAAWVYIHRLVVEERAIVLTRRNVHRLLLAALRVAEKALDDRTYPHLKVARVGGVTTAELTRLEVYFCFLTGFRLVVREEEMLRHWLLLRLPIPPDVSSTAESAEGAERVNVLHTPWLQERQRNAGEVTNAA